MKQTCILVLGMHRSGTSALTGVLNTLGVYLGSELMSGNNFNKKGYFENNKFFAINETLLKQIDSSWDDIFFNPDKILNLSAVTDLRKIIKEEFEYSNLFAIKDPRITFLIPFYKRALEELNIEVKVVIPYRNPIEVANSLAKRNNFSIEKGLLLWTQNFLLTEKYSRTFDRIFIDFNNLMQNTESTLSLISEKLNIKLEYSKNKEQINDFLNPQLKHHNLSLDNLSEKTPSIIKKILELIQASFDSEIECEFDVLRKDFYSYQTLFFNQDIKDYFFNCKKTQLKHEKNIISLDNNSKIIENQRSELDQNIKIIENQRSELDQNIKIIENQRSELDQNIKIIENQQNELNQYTKIIDKHQNELEYIQQKLVINKEKLTQKANELKSIKIENDHLKNELVELYTERGYGLTRRIKKMLVI